LEKSKLLPLSIFIFRKGLGSIFVGLSLLALSAPIIQSIFDFPSGEGIYGLLSPICHQFPTRSFWVTNRPMALCSRCFGGYLGLGIGLLLINTQIRYLKSLALGILLIIPGIVDGSVQLLTQYESKNAIRFILGSIGGLGLFFMFFPFGSNSTNKKGTK
jgi:uncharacterized membrane protein